MKEKYAAQERMFQGKPAAQFDALHPERPDEPASLPAPASTPEGGSLPALLARASARLLEARTSADVLEAKQIAELAMHYAKVTKAANETHADCLRIITRAEMRMADEIDAGQARGELAGGGRPEKASEVPTLSDLGLRRDQVHDFRAIRDAGEGVVETAIGRALAEGRAPTKSEILEAAKEIRTERADRKRETRDAKLVALSNRNAPLPRDRKYPIILADPPWRYDFSPSDGRSVENHYGTLPLEDIMAFDVGAITTPDAMLFLWVPPCLIQKGLRVLEAWGFQLSTSLAWIKDKIGTGIYVRQRHELLFLGRRGNAITPRPGNQPDSVIEAPRGRHSEKPAATYALIERMYPGLPKIELFARGAAGPGWDIWGNEIEAATPEGADA
jgi:N6-adenosine-specific RNA methylase IME4